GVNPDQLAGMGAHEAIDALQGDFADTLPVLDMQSFPGPIAAAMFASDATITGIQGPVGSGKTTTLLKSRFRRAKAMPRSVITGIRQYKLLVVRETYRQLWSTTIPSYLEVYPKNLGKWSGGRGDPVTHTILFEDEFGPIEWVAEFMAFGDDIIASMRGIQTTDMWLNEADTMPNEVLGVGIGRINRWPGRGHFEGYPPELRSYGQIVADFNAPDEDNYTVGVFHDDVARARIADEMNRALPEGAKRVSVEFYNQPGYGEPGCENLHNLSPDYYPAQLQALKLSGRGDLAQRLVYNKITHLRAGEPVFQREFSRRVHVSDATLEPWPGIPLRLGLDQGFKGAAVIAQFDRPYQWQILAELHFPKERLMAKEFGRRLRELLDTPRLKGLPLLGAWADMAGEMGASAAADENDTWNLLVSQSGGFKVRPQRIGTNRLQPRLEAVRAALEFLRGGAPGLLIDPACKLLIAGFEARYVWTDEVTSTGDKRKVPDKRLTEANVMDALQYLLLSETLGSGESRVSNTETTGTIGLMGHNGGPSLGAGLRTAFDILDPYGV
uniref:hypothetical protein n=1 Tax=Pararhodobacter sp. TaxID=2127056 RepID=UPI002FDE1DA5